MTWYFTSTMKTSNSKIYGGYYTESIQGIII